MPLCDKEKKKFYLSATNGVCNISAERDTTLHFCSLQVFLQIAQQIALFTYRIIFPHRLWFGLWYPAGLRTWVEDDYQLFPLMT